MSNQGQPKTSWWWPGLPDALPLILRCASLCSSQFPMIQLISFIPSTFPLCIPLPLTIQEVGGDGEALGANTWTEMGAVHKWLWRRGVGAALHLVCCSLWKCHCNNFNCSLSRPVWNMKDRKRAQVHHGDRKNVHHVPLQVKVGSGRGEEGLVGREPNKSNFLSFGELLWMKKVIFISIDR